MSKKKNITAILIGIVNSAIGAGGGLISVPLMKQKGLDQKKAQATTLSVILPLTVISAIIYLINGNVTISQSLKYIPFGFIGSVAGVKIMEKKFFDEVIKEWYMRCIWEKTPD